MRFERGNFVFISRPLFAAIVSCGWFSPIYSLISSRKATATIFTTLVNFYVHVVYNLKHSFLSSGTRSNVARYSKCLLCVCFWILNTVKNSYSDYKLWEGDLKSEFNHLKECGFMNLINSSPLLPLLILFATPQKE